MPAVQPHAKPAPAELVEDMSAGDLIDVLSRLRFDSRDLCLVQLDRGVRDFLVAEAALITSGACAA